MSHLADALSCAFEQRRRLSEAEAMAGAQLAAAIAAHRPAPSPVKAEAEQGVVIEGTALRKVAGTAMVRK